MVQLFISILRQIHINRVTKISIDISKLIINFFKEPQHQFVHTFFFL